MTSVKNTQNALLAEAKILEMERAEAERERQDIERREAERRAAQEQATIERGRALAEQVQREVAARQAQEEAAARAWAAQEEQGRLAHAALDAEKRALWNDAVKQRAAEKLEVLSTMAVISGLKRRIEIVDSSLVSAQTLAAQKLAADTLARLQAAERAAAGAAATEAALRMELEDSLKIKTELFDTCKKLAKQLQDAQRGLSDGEKEQAQAKLKDSQIKVLQTENESLEAQLRQAWKECQDQADLNTALAAELKVQAIASASQESRAKDTDVGADASAGPLANTATEDTDEGARRKRDTGDDGSKVTALEKRVRELMGSVHELEMTVDIKDDDLRQAHVLLGERDKELKELKPLLHQLQEVNKQLEERAAKDEVSARPSSDAVEQYASPDYIKKLRHETNSSAAVMKQFRAALEQAESRAHEMEEQTRTSKESVEVASHAAQEKIKALEAQCMYYQQQLEHERAGRPASGAHNAPLQGGCTKCAQYEQHLALLQAASRRAESAAESAVARHKIMQERYAALARKLAEEGRGGIEGENLAQADGLLELGAALRAKEQEIEQLKQEREQQAYAWREISGEVSRLRSQLSSYTTGEDAAPHSSGGIDGSSAGARSARRSTGGWQEESRGPSGKTPGWCAPERDFSQRQLGGRNGERVIEGGGGPDPLVLFSSFNFANPLSWGGEHRRGSDEDS